MRLANAKGGAYGLLPAETFSSLDRGPGMRGTLAPIISRAGDLYVVSRLVDQSGSTRIEAKDGVSRFHSTPQPPLSCLSVTFFHLLTLTLRPCRLCTVRGKLGIAGGQPSEVNGL